jgi:hypothetical protein
MEPIIMALVYKIFNMRKYLLFSCFIFLTLYTNGQIVPIGTIIKTNSLNSVNIILNIPEDVFNTFSYRVQGVVVQGGSKSPIVENGFVIKERNNSLLPDILNAQKTLNQSLEQININLERGVDAVKSMIGLFKTIILSFVLSTAILGAVVIWIAKMDFQFKGLSLTQHE